MYIAQQEMVYTFGVLIAAILTSQVSEARNFPLNGLLDSMPMNCTGMDYCLEMHKDYPQETINTLLTEQYHIELGSAHGEIPFNRDGDDSFLEACDKTITYGNIYEIVDQDDLVRIVVQSPTFTQQIRIEKCDYPGPLQRESGPFGTDELENHDIYCVEKKMDYNFLVLTQNGIGLETVTSKNGIPVCCSCKIGYDL